MGWSIITYHDKHEQFRDSDLWLLRDFFLRALESLASSLPPADVRSLRCFFEQWDWVCPGVFTGAEFDAFISGEHHRWKLLFQAMERAGDLIAGFGDSLPLAHIHPIGAVRGCYYTQDLPVRPLLEIIGHICRLLSGHEPPNDENNGDPIQ